MLDTSQIFRAATFLIFLVFTISNYSAWKKKKYRDIVFYLALTAIMTLVSAWSYISHYVINITGFAKEVSDWVIIISYVLAFVVFIFAEIKRNQRKKELR